MSAEGEPSVQVGYSPFHDEGWKAMGNTLYLPDGTYLVMMGWKGVPQQIERAMRAKGGDISREEFEQMWGAE